MVSLAERLDESPMRDSGPVSVDSDDGERRSASRFTPILTATVLIPYSESTPAAPASGFPSLSSSGPRASVASALRVTSSRLMRTEASDSASFVLRDSGRTFARDP
ncbi:MAG: hypothetical protein BWX47_01457 [candidate division Hyd24-12 bacterium ADurb.Bin004]|nr:MAG: hypothetical protein BWX47_01457 [candidate division Hyd24-12 bacterium ADurb.Bin004]